MPNRDAALVADPKADFARLPTSLAVFFIPLPSWLNRLAAPLATLLAALPTWFFKFEAALPKPWAVDDTVGVVAGPPVPNVERGDPLGS